MLVNTDHVILSLKLDFKETKEIGGALDNIHIIPEENAQTKATIYERGKKGHTKYFLIPKVLRSGIRFPKNCSICCSRIDSDDKILWTYFTDNY